MENYINYWLRKMVEETPNDAELGSKIRNVYWDENKSTEIKNKHDEEDRWIFERNPITEKIRKRKIVQPSKRK